MQITQQCERAAYETKRSNDLPKLTKLRCQSKDPGLLDSKADLLYNVPCCLIIQDILPNYLMLFTMVVYEMTQIILEHIKLKRDTSMHSKFSSISNPRKLIVWLTKIHILLTSLPVIILSNFYYLGNNHEQVISQINEGSGIWWRK